MEFRTIHQFENLAYPIDYTSNLFTIGSCFAEHMASKLIENKITVHSNPNGIIYNPMSIAQSIEQCIHVETAIPNNTLFEYGGSWHSWNHHGIFSKTTKKELEDKIAEERKVAHLKLKTASHLIITWGSAFVYEKLSDNAIVANCHKVPGKLFSKRLLSPTEVINRYQDIIKLIRTFNPNICIIWTVSPVKHVRDGLHENNLSKSTLLLAMNELKKEDNRSYYFPSFELVQDELRDYRFYKEDMAHPSSQAIDYVWESFTQHSFSKDAIGKMDLIQEIRRAMAHRPLKPNSAEHDLFKANYLKKALGLKEQYTFLNMSEEIAYFSNTH